MSWLWLCAALHLCKLMLEDSSLNQIAHLCASHSQVQAPTTAELHSLNLCCQLHRESSCSHAVTSSAAAPSSLRCNLQIIT